LVLGGVGVASGPSGRQAGLAIGCRLGFRRDACGVLTPRRPLDAASYGAAELDSAVASFVFDVGNLGFANI
jgi:hypothetical protein